MSSIGRVSTEVLKRQGVQKKTLISGNRFIDRFPNGSGTERSLEAGNISLSNLRLEKSFISVDDFFVAKGYFLKNGTSESNAEMMALIVNDMAKAAEVSVSSFLYNTDGLGILMNIQDYELMNVFRTPSNKMSILIPGSNSKCLRSRDIIA